jgi:hypothetical protein
MRKEKRRVRERERENEANSTKSKETNHCGGDRGRIERGNNTSDAGFESAQLLCIHFFFQWTCGIDNTEEDRIISSTARLQQRVQSV